MTSITLVVGARPQFVKLAPLMMALEGKAQTSVIHTGQHYDEDMSDVFFEQLGIRPPDRNLEIGSGPHGRQTGRMLEHLESCMLEQRPDVMVVFGDTNSTLAAALAARKIGVPVAHVEAGLRSYADMPEEVNRVLTDHISTYLFIPSEKARGNLEREGLTRGVHNVGDIMLDNLRLFGESGESEAPEDGDYLVTTLHRAELTDQPDRLYQVLKTLANWREKVLFPVHPRTRAVIDNHGWASVFEGSSLKMVTPLSYKELLRAVTHSRAVVTDSGGLQKEAYFLGAPCITVRGETEWTETVDVGWNRLVGLDATQLQTALEEFDPRGSDRPDLYGDGHTAQKIADILLQA